ncbi:MAG: hypothetical protein ABFD69_15205 [Candidatus Sumerlaeia bacterium]
MDDMKNRRRHFWINPTFQTRYIARIFALQVLTMAATAVFTLMLAFVLFDERFKVGPGWNQIFAAFVVIAMLVAAGVAWLGVRISHKICGPAFRIAADLKSFREGQPTRPIRLREGDDLGELAEALNQTIEHWQKNGIR